jgi:uncharacterized Zn finger protein (UPF0148 family)
VTISKLPEINLTCRNGHTFATRARGGTTVRCKTCGAPKHVPTDRPRSEREHQAVSGPADSAARVMADRWEREPEWDGQDRPVPGRPGDVCPECDGPLLWEPGRTRVYCPGCQRAGLPAAVTAHYERAEQRRAEVAIRAAEVAVRPDAAAERAARVRLHAAKQTARRYVEARLDDVADEECYDLVQDQRQAAELATLLRAYLPEIDRADNEEALGAIFGEICGLLESDQGKALFAAYEAARNRAQRQWEAQERAREAAERQREFAEQERQEAAEREREQREAERQAALAARERKTITTDIAGLKPGSSAYAIAQIGVMIEENRRKKAERLAANGECQFTGHRGKVAATRLYWVPARDPHWRMNGYAQHGAPQYRACAKHYSAAEAQLNREGWQDVCYWDLPLQQPARGY